MDVSNNWLDIFIGATLKWSTHKNTWVNIWLLLKNRFSFAIWISLFEIPAIPYKGLT